MLMNRNLVFVHKEHFLPKKAIKNNMIQMNKNKNKWSLTKKFDTRFGKTILNRKFSHR